MNAEGAATGRAPAQRHRSPGWERALALALRTAHLMAVIVLGAAQLGAPIGHAPAAAAVLASGLALGVMDLSARRLRATELAGVVVLLKLLATAWLVWGPGGEAWLFWAIAAGSALSAHAPKAVRHWRPGASRARDSSAGKPG